PPEFKTEDKNGKIRQVNFTSRRDLHVELPVKSHTTQIKDCLLVKLTSPILEKEIKESFRTRPSVSGVNCI
ncbi:hypothetical protein BaRGS_00021467, partial [Batillaria attramentaria]